MKGYTGKILRLDLTNRKVLTIDTKDYEQWVGGHGIGSAIFWDLCEDKTVSGFDPKNVITMMTSPLAGTLTPSATSRTEVQGIGVQSYPIEWFTRSNFGGRFGAMLKFAGWDGIVIEGKADKPVYVEVVNGSVKIKDADQLWGLDTWETQEKMWEDAEKNYKEWYNINASRDGGRSTQKPAIATIGPAGENMARMGSIIHDAGNGAGQGGFGGIWGSKNLKAISVLGTGSVEAEDTNAIIQARIELQQMRYDVDDPLRDHGFNEAARAPGHGATTSIEKARPQGCMGCFENCRRRYASGVGNESSCFDMLLPLIYSENPGEGMDVADLCQKLGVNILPLFYGGPWLYYMIENGILGPNKEIHTDLAIDKIGKPEFYAELFKSIAYRTDIGADLADGFVQAALKWGREGDIESGVLDFPQWGYPHHYDAKTEVEWSYCSILFSRDINDHSLNTFVHWIPSQMHGAGDMGGLISAKTMVEKITENLAPYKDPAMLDYSAEGVYGEGKIKSVAWMFRYNMFYKSSLLYCDWAWPALLNVNQADFKGYSSQYEHKFYNAVTGNDMTFEEGMEIGRKIWNVERSIYALQGRHRELEVHADHVYTVPNEADEYLPMLENGEWVYGSTIGRVLEKDKFEDWKTRYFEYEGWDTTTGWPTRATLEELDLKYIADELEAKGKLGK